MSSSIAIIGAGPSGLVLARLLSLADIDYTIFELRSRPTGLNSESSGSLDLHTESGQLSLKKCGLFQSFTSMIRPGCEDTYIADKHGSILYSKYDSGSHERPEIDRADLIKLLRDSVPVERIKYKHKPSQTFNTIIGADGAWSRVRPLLTPVNPHYSDVLAVTLHVTNITTKYPKLSEMVGKGSYMALSPIKAIMTQRTNSMGTDSLRVYLMIAENSESFLEERGIDFDNFEETITAIVSDLRLLGDWGQNLKTLIQSSDRDLGIQAKPLYMLPIGHTWVHREGVTLLGDAAHLMTPFAGEGVNAAMLNAVSLAKVLTSASKTLPKTSYNGAIREYEGKMFVRANQNSIETARNLDVVFFQTKCTGGCDRNDEKLPSRTLIGDYLVVDGY